MIKLSKRLTAITDLVTPGNIVCDVGTDHAHVPIYLIQAGTAPSAIGMDVRQGPLDIAAENLEMTGLTDRVQLRRSDGLERYEIGEAQTCIIAGMGGMLMAGILDSEADKAASFAELILEPQSEYQALRESLIRNGLGIVCETAVLEEGKSYPVIKAVPGAESVHPDWERFITDVDAMTDADAEVYRINKATVLTLLRDMHFRQQAETSFGPCLIRDWDPILHRYLTVMLRKNLEALQSLQNAAEGNADAAARVRQIAGETGVMQILLFLYEYYGKGGSIA